MNLNNSRRISEAAPSLFYNTVRDPAKETPFYFECGDGWADLLYEAAVKLHQHIQTLPPDVRDDIITFQVKEKYGTLRFYVSYYTTDIEQIIQEAEHKSKTTCEVCGETGQIRGSMWLYTACDKHTREEDLQEMSQKELP